MPMKPPSDQSESVRGRSCFFCGFTDEGYDPEWSKRFWTRAEFLDWQHDGRQHNAWVCGRGRDAYLPGEPDDEIPDLNTCRGRLLDEWVYRVAPDEDRPCP